MTEPTKLTRTERWILSNQYRILEMLCPDKADKIKMAEAREVLEHGFEVEYGDISLHIDEDPISIEECKEVRDILLMHDNLQYAFDSLIDKTGIEAYQVEFHGFGGNSEWLQLGYAEHLCEANNQFPRVVRKDDLDSHMPLLPKYKKMLELWNNMPNKNKFTREDIIRLIGVSE